MDKIQDKIYELSIQKNKVTARISVLEDNIKEANYLLDIVYTNENNLPEIEWKKDKDRQKAADELKKYKNQLAVEERLLADLNAEISGLKSMSVINDNNKLYKQHTSFNVEDIDEIELFRHIKLIDNGEMIFHFGDRNSVLCVAEMDIPLAVEDKILKRANPDWEFIPSWPVFKEYIYEGCSIKDEHDYIEYIDKIMTENMKEGYKKKLRVMLYENQTINYIERGSTLRVCCEIGLYINKQCTKDFSQIKAKTSSILDAMKKNKKYNIDDFGYDIPLYVMKKIYDKD